MEVLFIHRDQTTRYSGDPGLRDLNLLDSAVAQPRASFATDFLNAFPFEMAASYLLPIVKNQLELLRDFQRRFRRAADQPESMARDAAARGRRYLQEMPTCRAAYLDHTTVIPTDKN